jgi:pimeloyl-ACP methyl ester carboxylesterase
MRWQRIANVLDQQCSSAYSSCRPKIVPLLGNQINQQAAVLRPGELMTVTATPEIGRECTTCNLSTNYHDVGIGSPVVLIHGSGPGVSAWANWRGVIPELSKTHRVIAPDMVGFGYSEVPKSHKFGIDTWITQLLELLDYLELPKVSLVGNSFGGALSLHFATRHPERVDRIVLMGAVSLDFELTEGLDMVWRYEPSVTAMRELMGVFAHNRALITDNLVQLRYEASKQRGMDKVYESLFPAPRQRWVHMLAQSEEVLSEIKHQTLLVHGREDKVIPLEVSIRAAQIMPNASLLIFSQCGHWTQIERRSEFVHALKGFLGAEWEVSV